MIDPRCHDNRSLRAATPLPLLLKTCFFTFVFFGTSVLMYRLIHPWPVRNRTTLLNHVMFAKLMDEGQLVYFVPHKGFYHALLFLKHATGLSYPSSAIILLSLMATLTAAVIYRIMRANFPNRSDATLLIMTGILMTVAAIYVPFFNRAVYFGQGSPNTWHNATMICVKPFAIISFYLLINFLRDKRHQSSIMYGAMAALITLITVYIKPSYILIFLPALAIYIPIRFSKRIDIHWKIALILLPAFLVLLYQYLDYSSGPDARKTSFVFLTVWRKFTPNVFVSILITIAFPLFLVICRSKSALKSDYLVVAWIATFIGMGQFALLAELTFEAEVGFFTKSANWIGGYLMGLSLLFIFTGVEFLKWLGTFDKNDTTARLKIAGASLLLALHAVSGMYYLFELLTIRITPAIWHS